MTNAMGVPPGFMPGFTLGEDDAMVYDLFQRQTDEKRENEEPSQATKPPSH